MLVCVRYFFSFFFVQHVNVFVSPRAIAKNRCAKIGFPPSFAYSASFLLDVIAPRRSEKFYIGFNVISATVVRRAKFGFQYKTRLRRNSRCVGEKNGRGSRGKVSKHSQHSSSVYPEEWYRVSVVPFFPFKCSRYSILWESMEFLWYFLK